MIAPGAARIALAHDWLVGRRGGELVLDRLARAYGPTDLHVVVARGPAPTEAIAACRIHPSPLQRIPGAAGALRRHLLPLMPLAIERMSVSECDLLLSTSSALIKGLRPPAGAAHLCYCHSPARYLWEQTADYARGRGGGLRRVGLAALGPALRRWDRRTAGRVTRFLANSAHTAARIRRCWDREAIVVHPPVRTEFFTPDPAVQREEWLLVVAALEPYKRTDLVVEAANRAGIPLRVVGTGSQAEDLARRAGPTVRMLGRVNDGRLRDLYRRAAALVFPQVEDFGIVPVEAQACGCPVAALRAGGALDTVTEETGVLFDAQSPEALRAALATLAERRPAPEACRANAERFAEDRFDRAIAGHVEELLAAR